LGIAAIPEYARTALSPASRAERENRKKEPNRIRTMKTVRTRADDRRRSRNWSSTQFPIGVLSNIFHGPVPATLRHNLTQGTKG